MKSDINDQGDRNGTKVTKFGNSLGITMTKELKQLGLELGDAVHIGVKEESGEIIIRKANKVVLPAGINSDFLDTLSHVMDQYDETLKGLRSLEKSTPKQNPAQ